MSYVQWRLNCDRLLAGLSDIRLVFPDCGGLLRAAPKETFFGKVGWRFLASNDGPYSCS